MQQPSRDTSPEAIAQFMEEDAQLEEGMLHADPFGDHGEVTHADAEDQAFKNQLDSIAAELENNRSPDPVQPPPLPTEEPQISEAAPSPSTAVKELGAADLQPKDGSAEVFVGDAGKLGITGVTDLPDKLVFNGETYARLHMTPQGCANYLSEKGSGKIEICGVV